LRTSRRPTGDFLAGIGLCYLYDTVLTKQPVVGTDPSASR
jgi:hypothetical protein